MVRVKATVIRMEEFRVTTREKKNNLPIQNKTNLNRAKDFKCNQKRTDCKNNQCKKKI